MMDIGANSQETENYYKYMWIRNKIKRIQSRIDGGEDPKKIFDYVGEFKNGFAKVNIK